MNAKCVVLAVLALSCACAAPEPQPPPPADSELARCVQDVEYAFAVLEHRHPDLFAESPRERFESALDDARTRSERRDVFFDLMRLVALAGDSHTRLGSWAEIADVELPVHFESWSDGVWIGTVQPDCAALFGRRLVSIDGHPVAELIEHLAPFVPHENDIVRRQGAAVLLSLPRALVHRGLIGDIERVTLELADAEGLVSTFTLAARPRAELEPWIFFAPADYRAPLYRTRPYDDWWWCALDDGATLYLQYNRCVERPEAPFDLTAQQCLAELDRGQVERFVIDLRLNGGGNSRVMRPLLVGLTMRRTLWNTRVFVLIGAGTYSSGLINAFQLARLGAELVGEPTSQKPDSFGEIRSIRLPNTQWPLDCSTKWFELVCDDRPSLEPDHPVANGFLDVLNGRDPALDWVRAQRLRAGIPTSRAR